MRKRAAIMIAVVIGCVALHACDGGPTQPSQVASSLTISGPTEATTGETLHFRATAHFPDGSSEDVTARAEWYPTSANSIYFTSPGVAVASHMGDGLGHARYTSYRSPTDSTTRSADFRVFVLDPGTFRVTGTITGWGGEVGGQIDVLEGIGQGRKAFGSGVTGRYDLLGVAGLVKLQVSAGGYVSQVHEVMVTGKGAVHDFALVPLEAPVDVSGVWTMTIAASPGCPGGLPNAADRRTYTVRLLRKGIMTLSVEIASPTLRVSDSVSISGAVKGARVLLDFPDVLDDFTGEHSPNLLDRLSPTETLSFAANFTGMFTGVEIPGTMAGTLSYWKGTVDDDPDWRCRADDHPVRLHDRQSVAGSRH